MLSLHRIPFSSQQVLCCRSRETHTSGALFRWVVNGLAAASPPTHFILHHVVSISLLFLLCSGFLWLPFDVLFLFLCLTKFNSFLFFSLLFLLSDLGFLPLAFILQVLPCTVGGTPWTWKFSQPPFSSVCFSLQLLIWSEQPRRCLKHHFYYFCVW